MRGVRSSRSETSKSLAVAGATRCKAQSVTWCIRSSPVPVAQERAFDCMRGSPAHTLVLEEVLAKERSRNKRSGEKSQTRRGGKAFGPGKQHAKACFVNG